jgi:hypothetical protein
LNLKTFIGLNKSVTPKKSKPGKDARTTKADRVVKIINAAVLYNIAATNADDLDSTDRDQWLFEQASNLLLRATANLKQSNYRPQDLARMPAWVWDVIDSSMDYAQAMGRHPLPSIEHAQYHLEGLRSAESRLRNAARTAYRHGWRVDSKSEKQRITRNRKR